MERIGRFLRLPTDIVDRYLPPGRLRLGRRSERETADNDESSESFVASPEPKRQRVRSPRIPESIDRTICQFLTQPEACCSCRTTSTCKTQRCECRKANRLCENCVCYNVCTNSPLENPTISQSDSSESQNSPGTRLTPRNLGQSFLSSDGEESQDEGPAPTDDDLSLPSADPPGTPPPGQNGFDAAAPPYPQTVLPEGSSQSPATDCEAESNDGPLPHTQPTEATENSERREDRMEAERRRLDPEMRDADLEDHELDDVDRLLDSVYGDHIHHNDGTQLNGGIEDDAIWQDHWRLATVCGI
jgi:hypothetical protein